MNKVYLIVGLSVLLCGCAWFTQAQKDVALSNATPLTNTETQTTQQQAQAIGNTVSSLPIPFSPIAGTVITFIAGWFLASSRGASIRKSGAVPIQTTNNVNIVTGLLQDVANAFAGAFTTVTSSSTTTTAVWQRVWKTLLATIVSGGTAVVADPTLASFLSTHPVVTGILTTAPSIILGIEKMLSNVPVVTTATPVAPAA
jgi:hypothetical protein